jgi:hypothetical protein
VLEWGKRGSRSPLCVITTWRGMAQAQHFDDLARSLGSLTSRRQMLRAFGSAVIVGLGGSLGLGWLPKVEAAPPEACLQSQGLCLRAVNTIAAAEVAACLAEGSIRDPAVLQCLVETGTKYRDNLGLCREGYRACLSAPGSCQPTQTTCSPFMGNPSSGAFCCPEGPGWHCCLVSGGLSSGCCPSGTACCFLPGGTVPGCCTPQVCAMPDVNCYG